MERQTLCEGYPIDEPDVWNEPDVWPNEPAPIFGDDGHTLDGSGGYDLPADGGYYRNGCDSGMEL